MRLTFCKINKHNEKDKQKQLEDMNKILNCEINGNDDYDNPLIPPKFKDKMIMGLVTIQH